MRLFLTLLFLSIIWPAGAQEVTPGNVVDPSLLREGNKNFLVRPFDNAYEGVRGSPFLFDTWIKGTIVVLNGDSLKNLDLNYDVYDDQLVLFSKKENLPMIPIQGVIRSFVVLDHVDQFHVFYNTLPDEEDSQSGKKGFYEILFEGTYKLFAKHKKKFIKADYEGAYNTDKHFDEFKTDSKRYFLITPYNSFFELKGGKKAILKSLEDDGTLENIVRDNQLDLKKEADLITFVSAIEKL